MEEFREIEDAIKGTDERISDYLEELKYLGA